MSYQPQEVLLYDELPRHKVVSVAGPPIWVADGVDISETNLCTKSVSTYPYLPSGEKDGDPIADRLFVQFYPNRSFVAVADGCNWGRRPQMAARAAVEAVSKYLESKQDQIKDVQDAGHYLLRSFAEAHARIVEGKEDIWEAGTTTLLSALCMQIEPEKDGDPRWGFLCASVGDCKAFIANRTNRTVTDVTMGNRNNVVDGRDPGGRLGPYVGHGWPDLRNLRLYWSPCDVGDLALIVSDGVHDNLDPQTLGRLPREFELPNASWDEVSHDNLLRIKSDYMKSQLTDMIFHEDATPASITNRIIEHCSAVTKKSRDFMEANPNKKQPTDYIEFPGKMDHTTCVAFVVGSHDATGNLINSNNR